MSPWTRDLLSLVLTLVLGALSGCPVTGCAAEQSTRGQELASGSAMRDIGPGATVRTFNLDGVAAAAVGSAAVAALATAGYALWKRDPNSHLTKEAVK